MSLILDRAVYLEANGLNKTLKQAIIDGDIGAGGGGGGGVEIFNATITTASTASTLTGLLHFRSPSSLTISGIIIQLYEKGGISSGTLEVDIKKNTTPNDTGMTSIFSVKPSFNFASALDYDTSTGTVSTSALSSGDYLRLDITSIPSGFKGSIQVMVYA